MQNKRTKLIALSFYVWALVAIAVYLCNHRDYIQALIRRIL